MHTRYAVRSSWLAPTGDSVTPLTDLSREAFACNVRARAVQATVGLIGLLLGSAGAGFLDPVAALIIAAIAAREGIELWQGDACGCQTMPGLGRPDAHGRDERCDC